MVKHEWKLKGVMLGYINRDSDKEYCYFFSECFDKDFKTKWSYTLGDKILLAGDQHYQWAEKDRLIIPEEFVKNA